MCDKCASEYARERARKSYLKNGHTKYVHICPVCNTKFETFRNTSVFCNDCRKTAKRMLSDFGGNYTYSNSTIARLVWEHRYVAENIVGKRLGANEVVHHLDIHKNNNSLNNLIIISSSYHTKLHKFIEDLLLMNNNDINIFNELVKSSSIEWLKSNIVQYKILDDMI